MYCASETVTHQSFPVAVALSLTTLPLITGGAQCTLGVGHSKSTRAVCCVGDWIVCSVVTCDGDL